MKLRNLVLLIAVPLVSGMCGTSEQARIDSQHVELRLSLEEKSEQPFTLPAELLQLLRQDKRVQSCIAQQGVSAEFSPSWFTGASIRLGPAQQQGYLVMAAEPCLLGANIGPFWLFRKNNGRYDLLLQVDAHTVEILHSTTNGYPDIRTLAATASQVKAAVFRFDGKQYRLIQSKKSPIGRL